MVVNSTSSVNRRLEGIFKTYLLIRQLTKRVSVNIIVSTKEGHPLPPMGGGGQQLHAVEGGMVRHCAPIPVGVVGRAV